MDSSDDEYVDPVLENDRIIKLKNITINTDGMNAITRQYHVINRLKEYGITSTVDKEAYFLHTNIFIPNRKTAISALFSPNVNNGLIGMSIRFTDKEIDDSFKFSKSCKGGRDSYDFNTADDFIKFVLKIKNINEQ